MMGTESLKLWQSKCHFLKVGNIMKNFAKILGFSILGLVVIAIIVIAIIFFVQGNTRAEKVPEDVAKAITAQASEKKADTVRVMSSNLWVHYKSWGGEDARPRAKMYFSVMDEVKPDVIAMQELCDMWYACFALHKMPYKLLYPVSTGALVRFTALAYNTDTTELIEQGQLPYSEGDNSRLRRVVWGLFEDKATKKRYVVLSTHLDLIRGGKEEAQLAVMKKQAQENVALAKSLQETYQVPVFSCGDFNTYDHVENRNEHDQKAPEIMFAPTIYQYFSEELTDTRLVAKDYSFGGDTNKETPAYDHIFLEGDAEIDLYASISDESMQKMSDHYSIFVDAKI